ncbi:MAG: hypothetical protein JWO93_2773 [Micrococcaceae bacterium]|jgi:hypothetical protein|nr:hypothetical protein [Micrococcaceae bacterium]
MNNTAAIAAVTNALRNLLQDALPALDAELSDLMVTTRNPDSARTGQTGTSLNVFLYEVVTDAASRNRTSTEQTPSGPGGSPPLALNLHYLLTPYPRDEADQEAVSQRVLAGAMSVLHGHPVLDSSELAAAVTGGDVAAPSEPVRITWLQLSLADLSQLWRAFHTSLRLSAAYEATLLLTDGHDGPAFRR